MSVSEFALSTTVVVAIMALVAAIEVTVPLFPLLAMRTLTSAPVISQYVKK